MIAVLALVGCFGAQEAGVEWVDCDGDAIHAEATTHGFSLAFLPCGVNQFEDFAWSPDGRHLYFGLPGAAYVMNAAAPDKATTRIPEVDPSGSAVWLDEQRVAFPAASGADPARIGIYDLQTGSVTWIALPGLSDPDDLAADPGGATLLLLAADATGARIPYRLAPDTGRLGEAYPWLGPVGTLSASSADALVVGRPSGVTVYRASTGEALARFPGFERGALHPDGRWLALERAVDGRPELSFVDLRAPDAPHWVATGFHGGDFEWYQAVGHWGSFVLWGFDEQLRRNVVLGDFGPRLEAVTAGRPVLDLTARARGDSSGSQPPADRIGTDTQDEPLKP